VRPRVGVTGAAKRWSPSWWCAALALRLVGATPERISVRHEPSGEPLDALVVGGGDDIGPEHYHGELDARVKSDPLRDELEIHWLQRALERRLPVLGICRGAQLLNVVLGGTLHTDVKHLRDRAHHRASGLPTKDVALEPDSRLARICHGTRLRVNSLHHQAVRRLGDGLRVVARDRDGLVQAVEAADGAPVLGVQWHPEYLLYVPAQLAIFGWLARAGRPRGPSRG
jgi:putative glutamine amidotransferase